VLTGELRSRTEQLERERREREREAVAEERARIARELHDVVAHSVSVMVVQAGAARRVLARDPGRSVEALGAVEATGREALAEMRRLLGILRPAATDRAPTPSLSDLDALAERFRAAGLHVELDVAGEPGPLPAGVDLCAYRVVQEALTNAVKHAGTGRARVAVRWEADSVEVEVANRSGRRTPAALAGTSGGHGLMGMRERVALCGGELEAGAADRDRFVVRARLPREHAAVPA
jgi:signal transduction histidine kinase